MSITLVRSYFVDRCKTVGLTEHRDAFNDENVALSLLNEKFFVRLNTFNGIKLNQTDQEINCDVEVVFWLKGGIDPVSGLDKAVIKAENLLKEALKHSNRLGQCIKNVVFNSVSFDRLAESNDNTVKVTANFTAFTSIAIL
jgi:hypothetical protein